LAANARSARVRAEALNQGLLDAFCDALWLEDGLSRNTIASYRADLEQFSSFLKGKDLLDVGEENLFAFLGSRKGRASSAARRVSTLKRFYRYCLRERRIDADPTLKLDPPKRTPRFPKSLSEADVEALLAAADPATPLGLRDRAMLETLYATGLRVSELVTLKTFEVNLDANVIRVVGKGSKERLVPLGEEAAHWISQYLKTRNSKSAALFVTARRAKRSGTSSGATARAPFRERSSRRTCCATRSRRTSSTTAPTCGWCSFSSGTRTSPPRRSTRTSRANA
jgi:integrase/recombinase XerD